MEFKTGIAQDVDTKEYFVVKNNERYFWGNDSQFYRVIGWVELEDSDLWKIHSIENRVSWIVDKLNEKEITEDFAEGYFIGLARM